METQQCLFCLAEIPIVATRCRHCAADLAKPVDAPDLGGFWAAGILLAIVGIAIAASKGGGEGFGIIVASIGGVLLQIAVIGTAVSMGVRERDEKMWMQRLAKVKDMTT
jgi:hypothetical protein